MSLEKIRHEFSRTNTGDAEIEEKLQEEIEDMLADLPEEEVREEIEDLDSEEFRKIAEDILDYNT